MQNDRIYLQLFSLQWIHGSGVWASVEGAGSRIGGQSTLVVKKTLSLLSIG